MKKIFTFILLAISAFAMAQAYPGDPGRVAAATPDPYTYDTITIDNLLGIGAIADDEVKDFSGRTGLSGTKYAGKVAKLDGYNCMWFDEENAGHIKNTTSMGKIHSIKIVWNEDPEINEDAIMKIYGANKAFSSIPSTATTGTCKKSSDEYIFTTNYTHFIMVGDMAPVIDKIIIAWEISMEHNISITTPTNGTIVTSKTSAKEGESYSVTFTPNSGYELISYTINGKTTNISARTEALTLNNTMPNAEVTISAVFQTALVRKTTSIAVDGGLNYAMISGDNVSFTWTLKYKSGVKYVEILDYDGTVEIASSNPSVVETSNLTNNGVTLIAKARGTTTLTITSPQTDKYKASTQKVEVVVSPKQIYLVAEYDGKHYAMTTTAKNGGMTAVEVPYIDGKIVNPTDAMKWYLSNDGVGFVVQNSADKYLDHSGDNLSLASGKPILPWILQDGALSYDGTRFFTFNEDANIFKAYSDRYVGTTGYSNAALEVQGIELEEATPRTDLVADEFTTICLPYAFYNFDSNVKFYNMDDVEEKKDGLHFYFCEEDFNEVSSEPGRPYIVKNIAGSNVHLYKDSEKTEAASAGEFRGLKGTFNRYAFSTAPDYTFGNVLVISKGQIKWANSGSGANANRAYILYDQVPTTSECGVSDSNPASAARRVVLSTEQVENPQVPTAIENTTAEQINWNEPVYNIMGQRVARGTTGVLIQNGQKFIAE